MGKTRTKHIPNHLVQFFLLLLALTPLAVRAQSDGHNDPGQIKIISDPRLDKVMQRYYDVQVKDPIVPGYRIQIFSGDNRSEAQKAKEKFYAQFPNLKPFVVYQAPNFKLRIGNYRSRLEAYKDLLDISQVYSNAFIVKTEINIADL